MNAVSEELSNFIKGSNKIQILFYQSDLLSIIYLIVILEGVTMPERKKNQSSYLILLILLIFSGTGLISVFLLSTNYGTVEFSLVRIPNQTSSLTGLLYKPRDVSGENPLPTVICAHGFSNSKQAMSGLALELSRRGFVALALDLAGHGGSDPNNNDSTLGILSAIEYLDSLPYADVTNIGVAGHSMGAFATWATALEHKNITASVLLGGLPDLSSDGENSGKFNATFPKNVLIAIGKYDEFFGNIEALNTELMDLFGTSSPVVPNYAFYGSFHPDDQDARRLVISETIHILEPIDPVIVTETIQWMQNALKTEGHFDDYFVPHNNHIYSYRDIASIVSLISIVSLFLSVLPLLYNFKVFKEEKDTLSFEFTKPVLINTSLVWGCLAIILYFPVMLIGTFIPIPPMTYASSITLWFFTINVGLLTLTLLFPSYFGISFSPKEVFRRKSQLWEPRKGVGLAISLVVCLYVFMFLLEIIFSINLGFIITLFANLLQVPRIISFLILLPLFFVYFIIDGLMFYSHPNAINRESELTDELIGLIKLLIAKSWPFILIVIGIYIPRVIFGINLLPGGLIALSIQFFWVMGIFIMAGSMISWFWYRHNNSILPGAVCNTLLFVWILTSVLPI